MKKRFLGKSCLPMLAVSGVLFIGGCDLAGFLNRARIGFSEQAGVFAFNLLVDAVGEPDLGALTLIPSETMEP